MISRFILCMAALLASVPAWAQRQADLDFIRYELPRRHPNFFAVTAPSDFELAAAALSNQLDALTGEQFYTRLAALVAMGRDGHTSISLGDATASALGFTPLPVLLRWFDDGLFVTAAEAGLVDLNGARVVSVNGIPAEDVLERARAVVSYENEWWFRSRAPSYVGNLGVLRGLGVVPAGELGRVTFRLAGGGERTVELGARTSALIRPVQQMPGFTQVTLRNLDQNYWAEYWPSTRTLYIAYRVCQEMPSKPIGRFAAEIIDLAGQGEVETAVIDLRGNAGGNSLYFYNLLNRVAPAFLSLYANPVFRAYGLIDSGVYSSGLLAAMSLKEPVWLPPELSMLEGRVTVTLVGEPTGGKPTAYGEVVGFTLPGSGLRGQHSTRLFHAPPYIPDTAALTPDLYVPLRSTDYYVRHDPYLAALFARARFASAEGPVLRSETYDAEHPAARGAEVQLYATGYDEGATLAAWIGQQPAEVIENAPDEARPGDRRLRVRVPENLPSGPCPVVIAASGALSNAVSLWIQSTSASLLPTP